MKDYYALLGIKSSATKAEVKKNFRLLATKFHPDKNSAPDAAEKFIAITEAYEVLSDRKRRTHYDLMRWESAKKDREFKESFTVVQPPAESAATRRRKAQQKRAAVYKRADQSDKRMSLIKEGFRVAAPYSLHALGMLLTAFLLRSAIIQAKFAFEQGPLIGLGTCAFALALLYGIYKLGLMVYEGLKQDNKSFSVFYGITNKTASMHSYAAYGTIVLLLLSLVIILSV